MQTIQPRFGNKIREALDPLGLPAHTHNINAYSLIVANDVVVVAGGLEVSLKTARFSKQSFSSLPVTIRCVVEVTSATGSLRLVVDGTEVGTATVAGAGQYVMSGALPIIAGSIYTVDLRGTNVTIELTEISGTL